MASAFQWLLLFIRLGIGLLFAWSGWAKFEHFDAFLTAVYDYAIIPVPMVRFFAFMLPGVELLGGAYLILGLFTRWAAAFCGFLLMMFLIALAIVLLRGDAIDCGCFMGGASEPVTWKKWFEDIGLLLLCGVLMRWPTTALSVDQLIALKSSSEPAKP